MKKRAESCSSIFIDWFAQSSHIPKKILLRLPALMIYDRVLLSVILSHTAEADHKFFQSFV